MLNVSEHSEVKRWPRKGKMTGLFDADSIPYIVGYTSTEEEYLKFKRAKDPYKSEVWEDKVNHASYLINSTLTAADCDSALFFLTNSDKNFRLLIGTVKQYKGQRVAVKPPFFHEIKNWILTYHEAKMSNLCEADDEISIEAWKRYAAYVKDGGTLFTDEHRLFTDFCILSQDKDLNIIPGLHNKVGKDMQDNYWIDDIGYLEPIYKEVEINNYEYWPLFKGEPTDPRHLFTFKDWDEEMIPRDYQEVQDELGWEKQYTWYKIMPNAHTLCQDCITRGKNKGTPKFSRIPIGKKIKQNIDKLKGGGLLFFYAQIIMGDNSDNYPGLPGYGPKKAYDMLQGCTTEYDMFKVTLYAYRNYYRKEDKAISMLTEQGRLAWMQTEKFELWKPPTKEKGSYPL